MSNNTNNFETVLTSNITLRDANTNTEPQLKLSGLAGSSGIDSGKLEIIGASQVCQASETSQLVSGVSGVSGVPGAGYDVSRLSALSSLAVQSIGSGNNSNNSNNDNNGDSNDPNDGKIYLVWEQVQ